MRGFWSLIVTQFQGAFSDLTYRNLLLFLIIGLERSPGQQKFLVFLVGLLFSLPFVLFSMTGGWLADRYGRARVLQVTILWFSIFSFLSGFAQDYTQLLVLRTLQGFGFGAEWAMPARS